MILELHFVTYIRIFFGHCHVAFPYKEIISFFGHYHVTFPYMAPLLFLEVCTKSYSILLFRFISSIPIAAFRWQPLCYKQSPAFTKKFQKKNFSISANTYEKYLVCKDYCIAHHGGKTCFYPLVNIRLYYLETLNSCRRSSIHFALPINTWIVCIHYSSIDSVEKLLQRVENCLITCNEQLTFIKETRKWTECRALQKRDS